MGDTSCQVDAASKLPSESQIEAHIGQSGNPRLGPATGQNRCAKRPISWPWGPGLGFSQFCQLESPPDQALDGRPLGVGWGAQSDEPGVLPAALEEAAAVVKLAAPVEEKGRVLPECAHSDDVHAVDR